MGVYSSPPFSSRHLLWLLLLVCSTRESFGEMRCFTCDNTQDNCKYLQTTEGAAATPTVDCATQCYSYLAADGSELRRGCESPSSSCKGNAGDTCIKCTTDFCNTVQLHFGYCASCDSTVDENCVETVPNLTRVVACTATGDKLGCYRYSATWDGPVKRGCIAELDAETYGTCTNSGAPNDNGASDVCKTCTTDLCNMKDYFQRCFTCDSQSDPECLNLHPEVDARFAKICEDYHDSCAAFVIPNGRTARGCSKEINPEPTYCPSTNCEICAEPDCNYGIVPQTRIQCFQCNSTADANCNDSQLEVATPTPCRTFQYDDQCFMYYDAENGVGYRGCLSDQDVVVRECEANPDKCRTCSPSACNHENILRHPQLWCIQCDRTPDCMWSFRTLSQSCSRQVAFYETESCYRYLLPNKLQARRGCTLEDPEVCQGEDAARCETCSTYFCNGATYLTQKCVRCNSEDSPLCEDKAAEIEGEACLLDPTHAERGCYSFRDERGVVFRGCYFDMEVEWVENCTLAYKDRCTRCFGLNCNTNYQGTASGLMTPVKVSLAMVIITVLGWL